MSKFALDISCSIYDRLKIMVLTHDTESTDFIILRKIVVDISYKLWNGLIYCTEYIVHSWLLHAVHTFHGDEWTKHKKKKDK